MASNAFLVSAVVGALVPLLTGLLTKANAAIRTKTGVAAVLTWVGGVLAAIGTDTFDAKGTATAIVTAFLSLAASYQNGWKPLGVVGGNEPGVLDRATATFGLGRTNS